jgi:hypothetical protein
MNTLCLHRYLDKHGLTHVCQREIGHAGMHAGKTGRIGAFQARYRWHSDGQKRKQPTQGAR